MRLLLQLSLACSIIAGCFGRIDVSRPGIPCYYKGTTHRHGSQFKDECNTCWCSNGSVGCTEMACIGKPGKCSAPGDVGLCAEMCSTDYDCPDVQKCCFNGCGHGCA